MDDEQPVAEAMIIADGRIQYIGDDDAAKEEFDSRYPDGKHHDLDNKVVLPGFIDAHTHPGLVANFPQDENAIKLPTTSKEDLYAALRKYGSDNPFEPLIVLGDRGVQMFAPDGPRKEDLHEIFWRPVILTDNSGHSFWLNSSAL